MERIGFSTGSLARSDVRAALAILEGRPQSAVELSALRGSELVPLLEAIPTVDLSRFRYVSVHAPSSFAAADEEPIAAALLELAVPRGWTVVLHPDSIRRFELWGGFGSLLAIENMDKRKRLGRNVPELLRVFERLPDASLCFDIAHASQFDTSMAEAFRILREFGDRLVQVHMSAVDSASRHIRLTGSAIHAYQVIAEAIPRHVPVIIEAPVTRDEIDEEISRSLEALGRVPVSVI